MGKVTFQKQSTFTPSLSISNLYLYLIARNRGVCYTPARCQHAVPLYNDNFPLT